MDNEPKENKVVIERFQAMLVDGKCLEHLSKLQKSFVLTVESVMYYVPDCADRTHALRLLLDAKMWCSQAITHDGK